MLQRVGVDLVQLGPPRRKAGLLKTRACKPGPLLHLHLGFSPIYRVEVWLTLSSHYLALCLSSSVPSSLLKGPLLARMLSQVEQGLDRG